MTSTARVNRFPKELKLPRNPAPGTFATMWNGTCVAVLWKDRQEVRFLTSAHNPIVPVTQTKRGVIFDTARNKYIRATTTKTVLNVSYDYNFNMNGVDIADQLRSYYSCKLRSRKWWHSLFWWMVDTAICNAYVVYKHHVSSMPASTDKPPLLSQ